MLNRFKSAIYNGFAGTDSVQERSFGTQSNNSIPSRHLPRSSSFREDLLDKRDRSQNNNNVGISKGKSQVFNTSQSGPTSTHYSHSCPPDSKEHNRGCKGFKVPKFRYSRPEFLQLKTDDEIIVSADHQVRPIILPRDVSRLPWKSGYAECINAGKSKRNEDQASNYRGVLRRSTTNIQSADTEPSIVDQIPWVYFGIFDGHAGTAVAVAAAMQLHNIIEEKLQQVAELLIVLEFETNKDMKSTEEEEENDDEYLDCKEDRLVIAKAIRPKTDEQDDKENNNEISNLHSEELKCKEESNKKSDENADQIELSQPHPTPMSDRCKKSNINNSNHELTASQTRHRTRNIHNEELSSRGILSDLGLVFSCRDKVTIESLITGALESAFWEMDALIAKDKYEYKMAGGCTAVVALFILGKLYVCNAGDSRAIVYKGDKVIPMSFDFTPVSERERILRLGQQRPEFLGSDFTHLEFIRRPTRRDLGEQMLYRDAYMTGWSMKTITYDDFKFPLIWGEGKRSRVLATIGVTRGFGDHELRAQYGSVLIKPFLTPEPEIRILSLESDESLTTEDVLIMGSDGLWDVTTNQGAASVVKASFDHFPDNEESRIKYRYITAAQDLVLSSRGHTNSWGTGWKTDNDTPGSLDDIAVFVIPLKQYRDEYIEWKKSRLSMVE